MNIEEEREKLNSINQELMVANAECNELDKKLGRLHRKIYRRRKVIDELLDRKET